MLAVGGMGACRWMVTSPRMLLEPMYLPAGGVLPASNVRADMTASDAANSIVSTQVPRKIDSSWGGLDLYSLSFRFEHQIIMRTCARTYGPLALINTANERPNMCASLSCDVLGQSLSSGCCRHVKKKEHPDSMFRFEQSVLCRIFTKSSRIFWYKLDAH